MYVLTHPITTITANKKVQKKNKILFFFLLLNNKAAQLKTTVFITRHLSSERMREKK